MTLPRLLPLLLVAASVFASKEEKEDLRQIRHRSVVETKVEVQNEDRIIGGGEADRNEYPFFVQAGGGQQLCGGALVHEDIVVTAAHCAAAFAGKGESVFVGGTTWWFPGQTPTDGAQKRQILSDIIAHPDYVQDTSTSTEQNDVAVMLIERSTKKTISINTKQNLPSNNQVVTTIGHGFTEDGGAVSNVLKELDMKTKLASECIDLYGSNLYQNNVELCAGTDAGTEAACNGDSGGPLFTKDELLVGIVSWSSNPCLSKATPVFTRVSTFSGWIKNQICQLSANPPASCKGGSDGNGSKGVNACFTTVKKLCSCPLFGKGSSCLQRVSRRQCTVPNNNKAKARFLGNVKEKFRKYCSAR